MAVNQSSVDSLCIISVWRCPALCDIAFVFAFVRQSLVIRNILLHDCPGFMLRV